MVSLKLLTRTDSKGRPLWMLLEDYTYELGPGSSVTVPAGYITNFGTIPTYLEWWISIKELREAAIVHDYMCNEDFTDDEQDAFYSGYSRWMADAVLYEALQRQGLGWVKRFSVWAAVRSWAWIKGNNQYTERPVLSLQINEDLL